MKKQTEIEFLPLFAAVPIGFRRADFFRDFFFLDPIAAYPIELWTPYLPDLFDSLTAASRDFLFSKYTGSNTFAPGEFRVKRQTATDEFHSSETFAKLLELIADYELNFFCRFDERQICRGCQRTSLDAFASPLCSSAIVNLSFQDKIRAAQKPPPIAAETDDEPEILVAELTDRQVEIVLFHFGMTKRKQPIGGLEADGVFHNIPVVIWRPQTEISTEEAELMTEMLGDTRPIILVVDEQFLPTDPIGSNVTLMSYAAKIFSDVMLPDKILEDNSLPTQ